MKKKKKKRLNDYNKQKKQASKTKFLFLQHFMQKGKKEKKKKSVRKKKKKISWLMSDHMEEESCSQHCALRDKQNYCFLNTEKLNVLPRYLTYFLLIFSDQSKNFFLANGSLVSCSCFCSSTANVYKNQHFLFL